MFRIVVIALVCAGGLIAMMVYVTSSARDRSEQQEKISKDGGRHLAKRGGRSDSVYIPKNRPRTAEHRLLRIEYPTGDERARLGGRTLLVLRGNGVAHRRASLTSTRLERHAIGARVIDEALSVVATLPEERADDRFTLVIDLGQGEKVHGGTEADVTSLLARLKGKPEVWWPDKVRLRVWDAGHEKADETPEWPDLPGFNPQNFTDGTGAEYGSVERVMKRLVTALQSSETFHDGSSTWGVGSWTPVFR